MLNTILIYESKYGSTEEIIKIMAKILGPAHYYTVDEYKEKKPDGDLFIIGSPIYREEPDQKILKFITENTEWLKQKKVALFCTCLRGAGSHQYLKPLQTYIGKGVIASKALRGRLVIDKLDKFDYDNFMAFCIKNVCSFQDVDLINTREIIDYALYLKKIKDTTSKMPQHQVRIHIEEFIQNHDTCTLSTGIGDRVRGTPIEYTYRGGYLYILSEGGEKFANILLNNNVAISIYDPFQGMNQLGGMQIRGRSFLVEENTSEYREIIAMKGIEYEKLVQFPAKLYAIKVKIKEVEFIWYKFKEMGYEIKQYYHFEDG